MSTLGERILFVRKAQNPKMSQAAFADAMFSTRDRIASYELDRVVPDESFKKLLCQTYHVSPRWLDTGDGEWHMETADELHRLADRFLADHSEFARQTIIRLMQMPPEVWERAEAFLKSLIPPDEKKDPDQ